MPEVEEAKKYKDQMLSAKKRASDLQNEIDRFSVERKSFQDVAEENVELSAKLGMAQSVIADQAAKVSELAGENARIGKQLAKAEALIDAAKKVKEGLAALS